MNLTKYLTITTVLFAGLICALDAAKTKQKDIPKLDCFISAGDNHWLADFISVDSPAAINDTLDILKNVMKVKRFYWRGMQEVSRNRNAILNPHSPRYHNSWKWIDSLLNKVKTEKLIVSLAKKKGIEIWGVDSLTEFGGPADTNCYTDFPYSFTTKFRKSNPEWAPVDKYGFRRQAGPLCLAYPEARKVMIDNYVSIARDKGYSGIALLTYSETFSQHFLDEFGFNEPIVKEYKRRYGKDIRNYDWNSRFATREQWYRLRGEYVTKFLRELKTELKKYNIKLGIFLNPMDPYMPQIWMSSKHGFPTMGHIYMDVDTWVKEGLIDQFIVSGNTVRDVQAKTTEKITWICRGTNTKVSCWTSGPNDPVWKSLQDKGMRAVCYYGKDSHYFNYSGLAQEKAGILKNQGNIYRKMRFLAQLTKQKNAKIPVADILSLLKSRNVIMRRLAIAALALSKDKSVIPEIEKMLFDKENGVSCKAVIALRTLNRPESINAIMKALAKHGTFMFQESAVNTLHKMPKIPDAIKKKYLNSPNTIERLTMLRALRYKADKSDIPFLKKALSDKDTFCGYSAAKALGNINNNSEVIDILIKALDNKNPAVANRAAVSLGQLIRANSPAYKKKKQQIIKALADMFSRMGNKAPADVKGWGYKSPGDVLYSISPEGQRVLEKFKAQTKDKLLAARAWQSLWFHDQPAKGFWITEKYNDRAFADRPVWMKKNKVYWMDQDFENTEIFKPGVEKYIGHVQKPYGRWGYFSSKGAIVSQEIAASGKQSVKLLRGGQHLIFYRGQTISHIDDYSVSFDVYRKKNGSFVFVSRNTKSSKFAFGLYITPKGILQQRNPAGKPFYLNTGLKIPENKWCNIKIIVSGPKRYMKLFLKPSDGPVQGAKRNIPILDKSIDINCFTINPQAPAGNTIFIDNIKVAVFK